MALLVPVVFVGIVVLTAVALLGLRDALGGVPSEPHRTPHRAYELGWFRLEVPQKRTPAARAVDHSVWSSEERARYREAFKPVLERSRCHDRLLSGFFVVWCALSVGAVVPNGLRPWLSRAVLPGFALWLGLILIAPPALTCPACRKDLMVGAGHYCPECGSPSLRRPRRIGWPYCETCGLEVARGRRAPRFETRACTYCGLVLDDQDLEVPR